MGYFRGAPVPYCISLILDEIMIFPGYRVRVDALAHLAFAYVR